MKEIRVSGKSCIVELPAELTSSDEIPIMIACSEKSAGDIRQIVLNFSAVEIMNSMGASMLVKLGAKLKRSGQRLSAYGVSMHYRAIPITQDTVSNQLLKPMQTLFFPATGNAAVKSNLVDPLTQNLLTPLKKFLTDVDTMLERWDKDFATPVQAALDQRAGVRKQISMLRDDIGLA